MAFHLCPAFMGDEIKVFLSNPLYTDQTGSTLGLGNREYRGRRTAGWLWFEYRPHGHIRAIPLLEWKTGGMDGYGFVRSK